MFAHGWAYMEAYKEGGWCNRLTRQRIPSSRHSSTKKKQQNLKRTLLIVKVNRWNIHNASKGSMVLCYNIYQWKGPVAMFYWWNSLWLMSWEAWSHGRNDAQIWSPSTSSYSGEYGRHKPVWGSAQKKVRCRRLIIV